MNDRRQSGHEHVHALVVNPGLRFAIDHRPTTGLQVVPGIAAPMQVLPNGEFEAAVLVYLSFEHPRFNPHFSQVPGFGLR